MRWIGADEAVAAIPPGVRVLLPHGCMEPASIYDAIRRSRGHPEQPPLLMSGLQFGDYSFLGTPDDADAADTGGAGPGFRYLTWQVGPRLRRWMGTGRIRFAPLRYRDLPRVLGPVGPLSPEVVVLQCAPPVDGTINLGITCTFLPDAIAAARLVIAEVHPDMPRTSGATTLPEGCIDLAVEATAPLGTLPRARIEDVDRRIAARTRELVPPDAWVQLGVGAVPDAVLAALTDAPGIKLHSGMLTDPLQDFLDRADPAAPIVTGEVCGTHELYRRLDGDRRVSFQPTTLVHHLPYLSGLHRLVAINSAVEVDLTGQVNGESIDGVQMSGVGGSLDFIEATRYSDGGVAVIALRSTARGRSRIVARLTEGTPVTIPRVAVDAVVTEHGVARLIGLSLEERAEALIEIAAPEWRSALRDAVRDGRRSPAETRSEA